MFTVLGWIAVLEGHPRCCRDEGTHQDRMLVALTRGCVLGVYCLIRLRINPPALVVPAWDVPSFAVVALVVGATTSLTVLAH